MSKKRVHELGKQLKEQGIELSNQELVEKLHALGYDVKSHSSSLEDDQAAVGVREDPGGAEAEAGARAPDRPRLRRAQARPRRAASRPPEPSHEA